MCCILRPILSIKDKHGYIYSPRPKSDLSHTNIEKKITFFFQLNDPDVKDLFHSAGVTEQQLQDKESLEIIYGFIEQKGGINAIKQ